MAGTEGFALGPCAASGPLSRNSLGDSVTGELWLATGECGGAGSSSSAGLYFELPGPTAVGIMVALASGSRSSSADLLAGSGVNSEWSEAVDCGAAVCLQRGPIISMTDMLERA